MDLLILLACITFVFCIIYAKPIYYHNLIKKEKRELAELFSELNSYEWPAFLGENRAYGTGLSCNSSPTFEEVHKNNQEIAMKSILMLLNKKGIV